MDFYQSSPMQCCKNRPIRPINQRLGFFLQSEKLLISDPVDTPDGEIQPGCIHFSIEVPKIFMQQFWYTTKKVKDSKSYEFLLANKKCIVNAKVFRKILDICPRVEGEEFTKVQDDDATLTFITDLGYKGLLHKYTSMENVDYLELMLKVFVFQIDHMREKKSRDFQLISNEEEKNDKDGDADDENEDFDHINVDVEMVKAKTIERENKEKDEMIDAAKADVEKTTKEKGDAKLAGNALTSDYQVKVSTKLPLPSSNLSISSGFETTILPPILEIHLETLVSMALLPPQVTPTISIVQQTTTPIPTPPITIDSPTITTDVPESDALIVVQLRVAKLEKDVSELKKIDHSIEALASLKSQVLTVVEHYLGSKIGDDLQKSPIVDSEKESEKSTSEIHKVKKELAEKQKMPKYTIKSTNNAALKDYDQKVPLYQTMLENKSFNRNSVNHGLYHALIEALIEDENAIGKGVADIVNNHKRQHDDDKDDDENPFAGPKQSKKTKRRRTKDSECSMNHPLPSKPPKIDHLTQEILVGPPYNLLKGTCTSSIELEYNMEECFKALTYRLDWNNPERDCCPFDLTNHLPLKGRPGHLTIAVEYFFNNDLDFLKSFNLKKKYTTSITKTKAARCEIVGIEDMTLTLWSTIKYGYDKDAKKGI
nr:hypothetical protein [Tanacetum cinerariifolium]